MKLHRRLATAVASCFVLLLLFTAVPVFAQDALTVGPTGNVGIGTETPAYTLHVVEPSGSANLWVEGSASGAMEFVDGDAPADERIVQFLSTNGTFRIRGLTDGLSQSVPGIVLDLGSGDVGVGTASPGLRLEVENTSTTGAVMRLQGSDATCDLNPQAGDLVWSCSSDLRLKDDVSPADTAVLLNDLASLDLYDYRVISTDERRVGFIAQRVQEDHPERVVADENGTLLVQQPANTELLGAIQELHKLVAELQGRVSELETELQQERSH